MAGSTNFPRIFPFEQIEEISGQIRGGEGFQPENWREHMRSANFALGTLLTHGADVVPQISDTDVSDAASMSDEQLADAVAELSQPRRRQGLLRGAVSNEFLSPKLFAILIEMLLRYLTQFREQMPMMAQASYQPPPESEAPAQTAPPAQPPQPTSTEAPQPQSGMQPVVEPSPATPVQPQQQPRTNGNEPTLLEGSEGGGNNR